MMSIGSLPMMPPPGSSPRDQVVSNLEAQVEAGEITSEDSDAMLAALDEMRQERMAAGLPDFSSGPPSREEMQANFDSMLSSQVDSGTLTEEQADQLREMFENGDLGPSQRGSGTSALGGVNVDGMMQEFMNSVLEQLQSKSSYDESGETSSSNTASLLADFKV